MYCTKQCCTERYCNILYVLYCPVITLVLNIIILFLILINLKILYFSLRVDYFKYPEAAKVGKYHVALLGPGDFVSTYRVSHETWYLVNSFECLLPYTVLYINDFFQFISLKNHLHKCTLIWNQFCNYKTAILYLFIIFLVSNNFWKKKFKTFHQLSCFVGHPVVLKIFLFEICHKRFPRYLNLSFMKKKITENFYNV